MKGSTHTADSKNPFFGGAWGGRFTGLAILMGVAILGITGFQLYWLKQNYTREKKSLELKTNTAFHETIMKLQGYKLKLDGGEWSEGAGKPDVKIFMTDEHDSMKVRVGPGREQGIISRVNVIRDKMKDSLKKMGKRGVVISMDQTTVNIHGDTTRFNRAVPEPPGGRDYILNLLYGVDSLQDSLRVSEIDSAYGSRLEASNLVVPFTIVKTDSADEFSELSFNRVTVGFAKPVTYELKLGNTFPYLLRQIAQPILFSLLLLGVTILSFVLLYRNMLKQQRLAELKNEFISNITHELKTPIATVGVAIEALKNFNAIDDPQRTREYLDISGNELQRLSLLVDKVLKLSMFEKKEIDLKYELLDLHDLVQEVVSSLRLQIEKQHAKVTVTREGDVSLPADRLHLLSVVFNLLDNALKYGNENPEIHIQLTGSDDNVVMTVADNGIGIAAEYKDKVFEKFFRVPHGDTHNAKGYGLGLSYATQVIRKHKGTIRVESEKDKGTSFIITLPKTKTT